jgi:hypothetical protein
MPALSNTRYERFAQLIAEGKKGPDAYISAGFPTSNRHAAGVNAAKLKQRPEVAARIEELCQDRAAIEAGTYAAVEKVVRELALIMLEPPGSIDARAERLADVLRRGRLAEAAPAA